VATYTVRQGEYISDATLNIFGDISAWPDLLDANGFSDWNPTIYSGQILQIPTSTNINLGNITALVTYPANNTSVPNVYDQITAIFALLETATPVNPPTLIPQVQDTNTYFTNLTLSTIGDAILNSSGDISNWSAILDANNWDDWTPSLYAGQQIAIPSTVSPSLNNFRALNTYPANNYVTPDIYNQINAIFDLLDNPVLDWILYNPDGQWNDSAHYWRDGAIWLDAHDTARVI